MPTRRRFISTAAKAAGGFAVAPAIFRQEATRPSIACGTTAGDVSGNRAIVWSCTDRPSRMFVEWDTTESFQNPGRIVGPAALEESGFTVRVDLGDLPAGQRIFYRVQFEDLSDSRNVSETAAGSFVSPPAGANRDVTLAWSADTVGQGWGIDPARGGMTIYEAMRRAQPDFFIHCGDTIYADNPLPAEIMLPDGTLWKNIVTPAKAKVAETLEEFRGNHRYNLLDANVRRFNSEVAQIALWDDHEVRNNWYPTQTIDDDARYTVKSVATLSARARQAFLEHVPIRVGPGNPPRIFRRWHYGPLLDVFALDLRTYRGANSPNRQRGGDATAMAGKTQLQWLEGTLVRSTATWKIIASDLPLGLIVRDGEVNFEAFANGDGPPLGRELELARLLRFIKHRQIRNVVWVTADVHYAAAHYYDPQYAQFKDFQPFWEFVAGPLHAGTSPAVALDDTFGPQVKFTAVPPTLDTHPGPAAGLQFFGTIKIEAATRAMTVRLHKLTGETIYTVTLPSEL